MGPPAAIVTIFGWRQSSDLLICIMSSLKLREGEEEDDDYGKGGSACGKVCTGSHPRQGGATCARSGSLCWDVQIRTQMTWGGPSGL